MDDGVPALEVGFAIDTGGSFTELERLRAMMNSSEMTALKAAAEVERAFEGIKLGKATAEVTTFTSAATRELINTAQATARAEKAGEAMVRQLDRQAAAFGKTRAETAALAAEQRGLTELAERIRGSEATLSGMRSTASAEAVAAAEKEAQARRSAAQAHDMFEAAVRRGLAALREQQALEAEAARQIEVARARAEAEARVNTQLLERSRIEAALERTTGVGRGKATDAGATFSALAAKAAEDEARAIAATGAAAAKAAKEHEALAAAVQGSHAAQLADAEAAERLRLATDPLYAATKRLNAEIAESTRLYRTGATAPAEYARQQDVLNRRLQEVAATHATAAKAANGNAFALKQVAIQMPDVVQGLLTGQRPMDVLIQQGGQLTQIALMAEGGLKAMAVQAGLLALRFAPLAAVAAVAWGAMKLFQAEVADDGDLTRYRDGLGLTHKEMLKLSDGVEKAGGKIKELGSVTVTTGDILSGLWQTVKDTAQPPTGDWSGFKGGAIDAFRKVLEAWNVVSAGITAGIYGTANAAKVIWQNFAGAVGDYFYQAVNFAISAMNQLVKRGTDLLNGFIHAANKLPGLNIADLAAPQIAQVGNPYAGAASVSAAAAAAKAIGDGFRNGYADARKEDASFWKQVGENAKKSYKSRADEEAAAIKASRTPTKPKVDEHAAQLVREAEATEAQIRNLYKLANAYGVSGAAALIAEAREKAESKAIKQRADIEEAVARQVRLAIAQRVSDAAKASAAMREQAIAQEAVNGMVAAGTVPAERAADLVKERIAQLPLLAAIEAAQKVNDLAGAKAATAQLEEQRAARQRLSAAEASARNATELAAGSDQLATLQKEYDLIGATNAERVHALALLKATQEANRKIAADLDPTEAAAWLEQQVAIADQTERNAAAARDYDEALGFAADKWDLIARNVQDGARGMADAFGDVGRAIGDLSSIYADYSADQARADAAHLKALRDASSQGQIDRENAKFALASSTKQIGMYGDMASAAKGFFKEKSAGYQAAMAAEKVFRAFQFAMSVRQMVQDVSETISSVANSGARATAAGAEGVATQAKLPFPFNIAAMAATGAALLAAGIAVLGGGGSSAPTVRTSEDYQKAQGTGSVLGDASAKSSSIGNSLELMMKNSNKDLEYSSQMVRSLRAIEGNLGNLASAVAREMNLGGGLDASKLALGTNTSGGLLGIGGLFSKSVTSELNDSGLTFGATTVGVAIANGITADLYQDILKTTKKSGFLGIGGSTKTTTQTVSSAAGADLTDEVGKLIASMRTAIVGAAGTIGIDGAAAMLDAFQIDIGRISLKGLTSSEIETELAAVFSRVGDDMAGAIGGGLAAFQHAGEGMLETLMRLAKEYSTVDVSLRSIGMTFGSVGLASVGARDALVGLFGGLDEFTSATDFFRENFLSEAEQMAPIVASVTAEMTRLGLAGVTTKDQFKQIVLGLDLSSDAGQQMYAALMAVAPAFAKTADYTASLTGALGDVAKTAEQLAEIAKQRRSLEIALMEAQGDAAGALAARRADDLAGMDESLRALQRQVYAAQDAAQAARDLAAADAEAARAATALASQRRGLEIDLMEALGDAVGAAAARRQDELVALDASIRPLKEQIYAAQDAAAANAALAQAQDALAEAARLLAGQRRTMEIALMEAVGDAAGAAAAKRADEIAALDATLRPLQEQIYAAQDAAAAQAALAAAQTEAAQSATALAQQRRGLEIQLMEAEGNAAGALAAKRMDEIGALDASLRSLQQQVYAAQDAAAANAALAQAQATAAQAAQQAAAQIAQQRATLSIALLRAQGLEADAVSAERALQLDATDDSLKALQQQVWAAQDAQAAAQAAAQAQAAYAQQQQQAAADAEQLARTKAGLEADLLEAMGDVSGALAVRRREELAAMDASLRPLKAAIYAQQDMAERISAARDTLTDSYKRESDALQETIDRFGSFGESLRKFRATLGGTGDATVDAYRAAQALFVDTSALAARGDETALGNLEKVSQDFLTASRDRAGSLLEYQRDVARVAGSVDRAIGASDEAVDYAKLQLDALKNSVAGLIEVNQSVVSVHDAIDALRAAMSGDADPATAAELPATAYTPDTPRSVEIDTEELERRIDELGARMSVQNTAIAENTGKIARFMDRWDGGGLLVRTDDDQPLHVTVET